jgi:hypothetical protein
MNSHLFYRKAGSGPDGWVISPELDESMLMVTTRDQVHKQKTGRPAEIRAQQGPGRPLKKR